MNKLLKVSLLSAIGLGLLGAIPSMKKGTQVLEDAVVNVNPDIKRYTDFNGPSATEPSGVQTLNYNETKEYVFKKNKVYEFKFKATTAGYYTFETSSDESTRLCVDNGALFNNRIFDGGDNRGDHNARVKVKINANQTVKVYVKMTAEVSNSSSAFVNIVVRKGSAFGLLTPFGPSSNDPYAKAQEWQDYENNKLKDSYVFDARMNATVNNIVNNQLYKRDVVIFGGSATLNSNGTSVLTLTEGSINFPNNFDFTGTEIVFFGSWHTGSDTVASMAQQAVQNGAKCAIGFTDYHSYYDPYLPLYASFEILAKLGTENKTVFQAIYDFVNQSDANKGYFDNGNNIKVYGNPLISLTSNSISNHSFTISAGNNPLLPPIQQPISFK